MTELPIAHSLLPRPREIEAVAGRLRLPARPAVAAGANPALEPALDALVGDLAAAGCEPRVTDPTAGGATVRLAVEPASGREPQGYRLRVEPDAIEVEGWGEAGLFHGVATLGQWLRLHRLEESAAAERPQLACVEIRDRPSFRHRGLLLDVSRNRVPTMETLYALVDRMASLKLNQLQLYMEHTFAYRGHEVVWRDASPLTAGEISDLDRYCAVRHVELVPCQNSFGHFHRWLAHEPYRRLAECPEGVVHPFSERREPFSLCPIDPGSLELLADLYDQLLPQFASRRMNAGLDETFDLGLGRSAAACAERGRGRVYLDFLLAVRRLLLERGRRLCFWADVVVEHPELVAELPRDVTPLVWGYEAGHDFDAPCGRLAAAGLEHWVCPGTSSWLSFAGRADNALGNLAAAARAGEASGAAGYLITDWGDRGHLQPPPASAFGILAGAAFAWNAADALDPSEPDWPRLLDLWAFDGAAPGLGSALLSLADAYLATGAPIANGTVLGHLVLSPGDSLEHARYRELERPGLERAAGVVDEARRALRRLEPRGGEAARAARELAWVADTLAFACRLGRARLDAGRATDLPGLPRRSRRRLRRLVRPVARRHPELWSARSRAGGLSDSQALLDRLERMLR